MRNDRERLLDIVEAAEKVLSRVERGRATFDADEDLQLAVTHLVEIIGEAAAGVSPELRSRFPELPWRDAARLRNRIIHGYFSVELDILWHAAANDIPAFAGGVRDVLRQLPSEDR